MSSSGSNPGDILRLETEKQQLLKELSETRREVGKLREHISGSPYSITHGIFSEEFLESRLQEEVRRSRRYRHYFTILLLRIFSPEGNKALPNQAPKAEAPLALQVRSMLRGMDLVFLLNEGRLCILLPETTKSETAQVIERIVTTLGDDQKLVYSMVSFPDDGTDAGALFNLVKDRFHQRREEIRESH